MSIIFEALKKIEDERKEPSTGAPSIVFSLPEDDRPAVRSPSPARLLRAAAVAACGAALFAIFFAPGWLRPPAERLAARSHPAPEAPAAAMKQVLLQEREIYPVISAPQAGRPGAASIPPAGDSFDSPVQAPSHASAMKIPELRLKGLSRSGNRAWAFINDRMLKPGDTIEGAEIVEVLSDRVKMRFNGVEFLLTR